MLKAWFQCLLAKQQCLREHRMLKWMGPAVHHPRLWGFTRQSVALGIAAGLFFAFMIPVGQIPCAAVLAVFLRANIPVAAAATLVTNPFTFGPIYYGAYCLGDWILDMLKFLHLDPESLGNGTQVMTGWLGKIAAMGLPLLLGLALLACVLSFVGYHAVNWFWRLRVKRAWRTRQLARAF
jgi:uncharacterized protein